MKYHIITYGCQMNKSDSERIAKVLESLGFIPCLESNKADLIIINICSVRQSAIHRANSKIKNLTKSKFKIILTGCILNRDKRKFEKFCNGIFKIDELQKLPVLLKKLGFKIKNTDISKTKHYLEIEPKYQSDIIAYVPIMTGCNNFCAYCVVPYVRGREISRPAKEIICEVKHLIKKGIKEIWLLGQNVNSYKPNFAQLLKQINALEGNFWLRFTSSHPKDLTNEMIEIMAKCQKVTPYFNLPIQSGDDDILKAMNRPYSVKKYKKLVEKTRQAFKKYRRGLEAEIALSSDVIVGFPNETKKQFKNTKQTFKEIKVSFAYISRYSPRPQTAAFKLKDNISSGIKKQRKKELEKIVEKTALDFNKKFLNKEVEVLILQKKKYFFIDKTSHCKDGPCNHLNFYIGKTRHYQTIKIPAPATSVDICNEAGPRCKIGEFTKAKVNKITPYGLEGKI